MSAVVCELALHCYCVDSVGCAHSARSRFTCASTQITVSNAKTERSSTTTCWLTETPRCPVWWPLLSTSFSRMPTESKNWPFLTFEIVRCGYGVQHTFYSVFDLSGGWGFNPNWLRSTPSLVTLKCGLGVGFDPLRKIKNPNCGNISTPVTAK